MSAIQIRLGGYGPPETTFSRALRMIGDRLEQQFGDRVDIKYVWNVMDLGYQTEELWGLVEQGALTLAYQSTSGLTGQIPELGIADLPFLFKDEAAAHAAIDGKFGAFLKSRIEAEMNYRVFGFFENGFRQMSNSLRPVRTPAELAGMRMRVLNSRIHARTFELLGAVPVHVSLAKLKGALQRGEVDAQENPLANTVTYGAHKFHRFHTMTNHFYVSRAVFAHRQSVDAWPEDLRDAVRSAVQEAVIAQRRLAQDEEIRARQAIEDFGCEVLDLNDDERQAFQDAVQPIYREARQEFGDDVIRLLGREDTLT